MRTVAQQHNQAMLKAFLAFCNKDMPVKERQDLFQEAYELEREAAMMLLHSYDAEPSRSVLFRSAANLAYNANLFNEAKIMAIHGLAGNPSDGIAEELKSFLD